MRGHADAEEAADGRKATDADAVAAPTSEPLHPMEDMDTAIASAERPRGEGAEGIFESDEFVAENNPLDTAFCSTQPPAPRQSQPVEFEGGLEFGGFGSDSEPFVAPGAAAVTASTEQPETGEFPKKIQFRPHSCFRHLLRLHQL
jgi:hypothetical protein